MTEGGLPAEKPGLRDVPDVRAGRRDGGRRGSRGPADSRGVGGHAARAVVEVPAGDGLFPPGTPRPIRWPEELQDTGRLHQGKWHELWLEYTARHRMPAKPPEQFNDAGKIREQWIAGGVCSVFAVLAAFFLIRTAGRSVVADADGLRLADGRRVAYADIERLDCLKWEAKGLAIVHFMRDGRECRARD